MVDLQLRIALLAIFGIRWRIRCSAIVNLVAILSSPALTWTWINTYTHLFLRQTDITYHVSLACVPFLASKSVVRFLLSWFLLHTKDGWSIRK